MAPFPFWLKLVVVVAQSVNSSVDGLSMCVLSIYPQQTQQHNVDHRDEALVLQSGQGL